MSGSGGSGGSGGGGGNGGVECQPVYRGARLVSPKENVLSKLKEGSVLDLEVRQSGNSYSLYALKSNEEAGTITHNRLTQIIRCIREKQYTYVAYVTAIDGGNCTLEIRMESSK
jgi:hypothetical protein